MQELGEFKKKIDNEIETFLNEKILKLSKKDAWVAEGMEYVKKMVLTGGKRIRPSLVYWGYRCSGGQDEEKILKACVGIELVHIFLLIHDDIIDRSQKRHGIETVNIWAEGKGKKMFENGDRRRFGYSMGMIFGDTVYAWAIQAIIEARLDSEKTLEAINYLQEIVETTIVGESQDVVIEYKKEVSEEEVIEMCKNKTAKYTFEGPLRLGGILAGASDKVLNSFSEYGIPIGIAFQIQDDILGVFGSEEKMGKSAASDIEEGKKTILTTFVFSDKNILHREKMEAILGKKDLSGEEINEFQQIIMDSGALKNAKLRSLEYAKESKKALEKSDILNEGKEFLGGLADYIINREL